MIPGGSTERPVFTAVKVQDGFVGIELDVVAQPDHPSPLTVARNRRARLLADPHIDTVSVAYATSQSEGWDR